MCLDLIKHRTKKVLVVSVNTPSTPIIYYDLHAIQKIKTGAMKCYLINNYQNINWQTKSDNMNAIFKETRLGMKTELILILLNFQ